MHKIIIVPAFGLLAAIGVGGPAEAANANFLHLDKDASWTNGPHVIAIDDLTCDGNNGAVQYKFSATGPVHTLTDHDGCSAHGISAAWPASTKPFYSRRNVQFKGKSSTVVDHTIWVKFNGNF